jgi:hypothetical protein
MSRPNTDKVKNLIKALAQEISKHGEEGKEELRQLFEVRPPQTILSLPAGPTRDALAAELIGDMREVARELAEAKAARSKGEDDKGARGKSKKTKDSKKVEKKATDIVSRTSSKVDGFILDIAQLANGDYVVKVTRKGRRVIEDERAPRIYDNQYLRRVFRSKDEAEIAARRVINAAMIWYDERGIVPREKARRSKSIGRGVQRRTPSDKASISREESETARIKRKKKRARDRKDRLLEEKVRGRKENPGRGLHHIPRKNPGGFFSFKHSEDSAEAQAKKSLAAFKKYKDKWEDSLRSDKPDFRAIMIAYDAAENARANLFLAGKKEEADAVAKMRSGIRDSIIGIFRTCYKHLSNRGSFSVNQNPSSEQHSAVADALLEKAISSMQKYNSSGSIACLLDAYKYYEMAVRECRNSARGTAAGPALKYKLCLTRAKAGAKRAREELKKETKG